MVFNDFRFRVGLRIILIGLVVGAIAFMLARPNMLFAASLTFLVLVAQFFELYRFISQTNRKLTRFLESIKYSDFISGFTSDHQLGKSFKELNEAFNEVLEAFRKARSEKEEHWQYLNTVVQQVRTGILSFDIEGEVQLINANAKKFMGVSSIQNLDELIEINSRLYKAIYDVQPGKSTLYKGNSDLLLTIQATEMRLRGDTIKLVTLQNIQTELQRQELEAWQNLTRVLRHEIMNSITPISSLTSTLREILEHDLVATNKHFELKKESAEDLKEGLGTIEGRSKGLIKFIDAYREYTSLPQPNFKPVHLGELAAKVENLMRNDIKKANIDFATHVDIDHPMVEADAEMIEQVLINLVKNAIEACGETRPARIGLTIRQAEEHVLIEVTDNGPGIIGEALDKVFVPFFSTKKTGSGIGLSLSRQIMQLHNGNLYVNSIPHVKTIFTLKF
ncbi:MAG TPA: ATP-binding protein [Cyclobacteriaceae bacterium]|nr:GHKL domain-containing protein [Cyclobacteriaceae bacterium]MCB9238689.1 GHKL domain-containing protein [Flammeovirgaceae bacterium]MCO5271847.1 ATP-binding protein [Cyclobacteriaceae bacterium]MCW5901151.1 GHKL domain-containing protein [Cyclobacteriaceae bacterium]HOO10329.1 ATP-binding protein [Cyclobacteriaceae bacterium]